MQPNKLKLVLADGHDIVRRGMRALLASHPEWNICAEAKNGRDAVNLTQQFKPDIVIMDLDLPELGGIEAAQWIRRTRPETEILVYTAHDEEYLIAQSLRAGVRGYVLKSDSEGELVEAIAELSGHVPFFTSKAAEMLVQDLARTQIKRYAGEKLSNRERDVIRLLADGKSNREIAADLQISNKTVETHRSSIMRKLGVNSITELVRYAIRNKLIQA